VKKVGALAYADHLPEGEYQDSQRDLLVLWFSVLRNGGAVFYNHKNRYRDKRVVSPMEWLPGPFALRQEIIWRRPGSVTQNARMFLPCDERIYWLYKGDHFTFNDETEIKTWSTVWDIAPKANLTHAVAFPVDLPTRCIRAASMPDDVIYDPFVGSGTTIIAAEITGRACRAIDLSPTYVDVAVQRWQNFTGEEATLEGDGRSFAAVAEERLQSVAA
jgi:DNA modification methylase